MRVLVIESFSSLLREKIALIFISSHLFIATFLGRFYLFAPDEIGYLNTLNNLYGGDLDYPQTVSGWITTPTFFLRLIFLPAKFLNLIGLSDILSLRFCTILFSFFVFRIIQLELRRARSKSIGEWALLFYFLAPSVLLWTSIGLRESYIYSALIVILMGLQRNQKSYSRAGLIFVFVGSFMILSVKFYLWVCVVLSLCLTLLIIGLFRKNETGIRQARNLVVIFIILPLLIFKLTAPNYAVSYVRESFNLNKIQNASARSGESISVIKVESFGDGIQVSGNSTAISIQKYFSKADGSLLFQFLKVTGLAQKIAVTTDSYVQNQKSSKLNSSIKSINPYALETPKLSNPLSFIQAILQFTLGPFPIFNDYGFILSVLSWESIIWWSLYLLILYRFILRSRNQVQLSHSEIFSFCFIFIYILISAYVEVNVGTALRHRSVLLIPLLYLLVSEGNKKTISK